MAGCMIALIPSGDDLDRLALDGGEDRGVLHLTLYFLGEDTDIDEDQRGRIVSAVQNEPPDAIQAEAFGAAVWNPNGDDPCTVLNVGGEELGPVHAHAQHLLEHNAEFVVPEQHKPWSPHICLAYDPERVTEAVSRVGPVTFDTMRVAFGDEVTDVPLGSPATVATQEASEEVGFMPYNKVHNHSSCPSSKPWAVINSRTKDVKGCHATEEKANAQLGILARVERGEPVPSALLEEIEMTLDEARAVVAADNGNGVADGECPPGHHKMPNGECMPDVDMSEDVTEFDDGYEPDFITAEERRRGAKAGWAMSDGSFPIRNCREVEKATHAMNRPTNKSKDAIRRHIVSRAKALGCTSHLPSTWPSSTAAVDETDVEDTATGIEGQNDRWRGVLAVEGVPTGDGREFAPGSLEWRDLPLSLYWQRETADGHKQSVIVGSIDQIWRDGTVIRARGRFNLNAPANGRSHSDAQDAHQLVQDKFMRGVSVTLDDMKDTDVEMVWPQDGEDGATAGEDNPLATLFAKPEKVIFHHGRIIDATLTGQPALQEAFIELETDEMIADAPAPEPEVAAVAAHSTGTNDDPWDTAATIAQLPTTMTPADARSIFAWVSNTALAGGTIGKSACRFPHHDRFGAANLTACSSAIGILNGGRGGADIPDGDRQAVYEHLASHLRDAGREPQPLTSLEDAERFAALTASLSIPVAPPAVWFEDPEFEEVTPLQVGDDGWVRGHLARWGVCHTSFANICVTPPHEQEFSYFTTGEIVTREKQRIPVGQLTLGTGHAPANLGARPATAHYDHTGYAVADVAAGADQHGIWVAGALCPDVDELMIRRLRASALSGDWRRIGGHLRLVAALVVNVPGFPIPRTKTRSQDGAQTALVAAGVVSNVEPVRSSGELSPKVAKLVADALRSKVYGPHIEAMRSRVNQMTEV